MHADIHRQKPYNTQQNYPPYCVCVCVLPFVPLLHCIKFAAISQDLHVQFYKVDYKSACFRNKFRPIKNSTSRKLLHLQMLKVSNFLHASSTSSDMWLPRDADGYLGNLVYGLLTNTINSYCNVRLRDLVMLDCEVFSPSQHSH